MELPNRMYEDTQIMLIGSHELHVWQILNNDIYDYDEKQKEKKWYIAVSVELYWTIMQFSLLNASN